MSGLRSQRERMMTWVSLRSGVASNGRCVIDQKPQRHPARTMARTRTLLRDEKSMMLLIMGVRHALRLRSGQALQACPDTKLTLNFTPDLDGSSRSLQEPSIAGLRPCAAQKQEQIPPRRSG